jgi:hypothetical protein
VLLISVPLYHALGTGREADSIRESDGDVASNGHATLHSLFVSNNRLTSPPSLATGVLRAKNKSTTLVERLVQIGFVSYVFTLTTNVMPFVLFCATFAFLYTLIP